jgi:predicted RecB family nuclease
MLAIGKRVILSATDLNNYLGCRHATFLDLDALIKGRKPREKPDPQGELLAKKGLEHEARYLEMLRAAGTEVASIVRHGALGENVAATRAAMKDGVSAIYQAALSYGNWQGFADFLIRVPAKTDLGNYGYEPLDLKLGTSLRASHAIQLCLYSTLLGHFQGAMPETIHLVLGDMSEVHFPLAHFAHYTKLAQARLEAFVAASPKNSQGEPCAHCGFCHWSGDCEAVWEETDHLSRVAGIARTQTAKLKAAGIETMAALAQIPDGTAVPKMQRETLARLKSQAELQTRKAGTGKDEYVVLPPIDGKGFARLPQPDPGDLFFDMEGDPLFEGGLEYLFGFAWAEGGEMKTAAFWGHSREEEGRAFERAMDFIGERLAAHPAAHIYHYANYEQAAFNALSTLHGTREARLDDLLRRRKFVDLYRCVKEGLRVSEPRYSIKNLEHFYMEAREGLASGGDSIVMYERWRELQEPSLLDEIEAYNATDCRSTLLLRDWLLTIRPAGMAWYAPENEPVNPKQEQKRSDAEAQREAMSARLAAGAADIAERERELRALVGQLLEFHRREAKPRWWMQFQRQTMSEEELIDDAECLGGLVRVGAAVPEKQSLVHTYRYEPQDFKMRVGDAPQSAETLESAGEIWALDEESRTIGLKIGRSRLLPDRLSLLPAGPIGTEPLRDAIYRYAGSVADGGWRYRALDGFLGGEVPRVAGVAPGSPIIAGETNVAKAVGAIGALEESVIVVQGPPGAGKTYTAAHAIVELLARGKRVGVSSNSHRAIVEVLKAVVKHADERGVKFRGAKKSSDEGDAAGLAGIEDVFDKSIESGAYQLIAGTAWLFAKPTLDQALDFLFIDEAGQVSLANVVASGVAAKNIVLIGDQMQLAQPSQGVHPGRSGLSALEFALGENATVPPELGIFLDRTRRMHPDVCRFISEAFYDGRLLPEAGNETQRLVLGAGADDAMKPTGISFVEVAHEDCSQRCEAEAARLARAYKSLLEQSWIDRDGVERTIDAREILVVSPYNMQVDLLRQRLPPGARVGTVDKFQGQEAAAVLISMATSSAADSPRGLDFLFSRNRLNVAISRARCFAAVFASPLLFAAPCNTVEQLRLVDALCWAKLYAG